jgi:hypothetical protein
MKKNIQILSPEVKQLVPIKLNVASYNTKKVKIIQNNPKKISSPGLSPGMRTDEYMSPV